MRLPSARSRDAEQWKTKVGGAFFFFSGAVDGLWVRTGMWVGMGAGG